MRRHVQGLLLLAGFSLSACTAILVPNADDDGVQRCNVTGDCPEIDDNRYVAICTAGEDQPDNSDQICSSDYAEIGCGETAFNGDHPLPTAYDDADKAKANYTSCDDADLGSKGCPPLGSSCNDGLEINQYETCDEPGADIPAVSAKYAGFAEGAGQDVGDQFCRSYFCDERFVCDRSLTKPVCIVCDPNADFGEGGCGTLYVRNAPSDFYTSQEDGTWNCSGNVGTDGVEFGPAPTDGMGG